MKKMLGYLSFLAILSLSLMALPATATRADDNRLSEGEVKKILKQGEKSLKAARNAVEENDAGQAAEHAARYAETLDRINQALAQNQVEEDDLFDVIERVDEATLKHESILLDLLNKVPPQAQESLTQALEASRRGHDEATAALLNHSQFQLPDGVLTRRATEQNRKNNDALLEHAERARERGDDTALTQSINRVADNMTALSDAVAQGAIDERDAVAVLDRVERNTRRHISKLEDLLGDLPEQAQTRANIQQALDQSTRGQEAAAQALQRSRAATQPSGWPGVGGPSAGAGGAPTGTHGQSGSRPGGHPSGPPSGRPGGPPPVQ